MNHENYFKDIFESIHDYKKIVLLIFLIQNDKNLLYEVSFSQRDISRLSMEFKNILLEEFEEYLSYIKNQEESIFERILNKKVETYFNTIFEDIRYERGLILLLSLVEPSILKQSKFTDHEIEIIKNLALEKLNLQGILKEHIAMDLLEKQFSD